ncbi:alpha/beta hydrolase [Dyadobacter chenwenxiniae]|uniref:Alpha/beta hydrolase n=1 Tax=Dyadobacter chenwenxiniae TaxID=2906456 RepID=A0A9X1PK55_9BACT|nr:alpha/beta hydrolase [Dyadobacter chenwenxiniae]MCF0060231.1 alpha/beta hydrolase [Dyadobacter chenwenxiniae]UON85968.1 alpha/beta hydrolase [Dyadobacter chenwenxiniae]
MNHSFKTVFVSLFVFTAILSINAPVSIAQQIYSKAYGHRGDPAIIYLHGGPRGNSTLFEGTTATALASRGFYVIVYDRRGEGRSIDAEAKITFDEAFSDLNTLIKQYDLSKVSLLGHSFGGIVSTLYVNAFPEKVERLILVGALFSQQESYDHILSSSLSAATQKEDTAMLKKISYIKSLDKQSEQYRKQTYEVASHFGFFKMPKPTEESKKLNQEYDSSSFSKSNIRNDKAPVLFYQNESRVNIDTKAILKSIKNKNIKLSAIYGLQDGIFSKKQLSEMQNITGPANFYAIENCSHYPFVDQQAKFLQSVQQIMNK